MKRVALTVVGMVIFLALLFVLGESLGYTSEETVRGFIEQLNSSSGGRVMAAAAIIGLLVVDIVLPVPSSVVMTLSGAILGFWTGGIVSLTGAMLAAFIGFFGCRWGGRRVFARMVGEQDIEKVRAWFEDYGVVAIILSRPVPMLTEILSCLAGLSNVKPVTFTLAAVLGTVPVCLVFSWFGSMRSNGLMPAVWVSVTIPAIGWVFTRWVKRRDRSAPDGSP